MAVRTNNLPARYTPGSWTGLVTATGSALLHPDFGSNQVRAVWDCLLEGSGLSACLEALATDGFAALPAFGLVQHDDAQVRVLVRGDVTVASGQEHVDAAGIATWRESTLTGPGYTISAGGEAEQTQWPIAAGIVAAGHLEWLGDTTPGTARTTTTGQHRADSPASAAGEEAGRGPSWYSRGSQIVDSLPWDVPAAREPQEAAERDELAADRAQDREQGPEQPAGTEDLESTVHSSTMYEAPAYTAAADPEATMQSEATVHPDQLASEPERPTSEPDQLASEPDQPNPAQQQDPGEEFPEQTVLSPHALRPQEGAGDVDIDGDHDGETIMVSELPQRDTSAIPGAADLYDEPAQPRQELAVAVSTGVQFALDRPILIGRAPESARFDAGVQPRLVTVPSPQQDISRTHVEIRAEGAGAVVTDLNSTNGTILVQPGAAPRRLHGGESASVHSGTTIDLGDGITVSLTESAQAQE